MAWWDKVQKGAKDAADRAAFEANKVMRVQSEERALAELRTKVQGKLADLGNQAVELYRNGTLADPSIGALVQELDALQAQLGQQQARVAAVKAEQFQAAGEPAETTAPPAENIKIEMPDEPAQPAESIKIEMPAETPQPEEAPRVDMAPAASAAPAPPAMIECPNCHTQVKSTAAFCPECGNKLR